MTAFAQRATSVILWLLVITFAAPLTRAQAVSNPVVWSAKQIVSRQSGFIVAAAEEMPAEKYGYHPTPDQWTFGMIVAHIIQGNNAVCAMLSDGPAPQGPKVSETDSKDTLVGALKSSFDFCDKALDNLQDAKLGDTVTFFRGAQVPRARALLELTGDLQDHYSQLAGYLRLNELTPPSAKPRT